MKLLPLLVFWCLWFLIFFTRSSFSPILPVIEESLSLSHGEAGGLVTSYSIGYAASVLIAGRYVSTWGYKRTVVAGMTGIGLSLLLFQWVDHYFGFHLLFFLLGLAAGTYIPSILPIITETYDPRHWGKAIGFHDSAASVAFFSAPILVAFGLQFFSWKGILFFVGLVSMLFPIFFWRASNEPSTHTSRSNGRYLDLFKQKQVVIMCILWILSAASNSGLYSILPLYLIKERAMDYSLANNLVGISRIGGFAVQVFSGFLVDRLGYKTILLVSLLSTGLSTIFLSVAPTFSLLLIALFLQAPLSIAFFPVGLVAIARITSFSERSMSTGAIISTSVLFGTGFAPFFLGLIADHFSFQIGILGLGTLTAFSSLAIKYLEEK